MNIDEVKAVVDRIIAKKKAVGELETLKSFIDNRTNPQGDVEIQIENVKFSVPPQGLKNLLDDKIQDNDTAQDETELKQKAK